MERLKHFCLLVSPGEDWRATAAGIVLVAFALAYLTGHIAVAVASGRLL